MTRSTTPGFDDLELGAVVAKTDVKVTRTDLVRYAGASGDFNPIHFDDTVAAGEGLPGVLCQGMLTAALGLETVVDWLGDPTAVVSYEVRFTRPVVVDPVDGADLSISAKVARLDEATRSARVDLIVSTGGRTVLGKTQVSVRFSS